MTERDETLESVSDAMELAMSLCETEDDHERLDAVLKRWRSRFEMLIEENTRALGKRKTARRLAGR